MKKAIGAAGVLAALIAGMIAFFWPMPLSEIAGEGARIEIAWSEWGVRDGEPYMDSRSASVADGEPTRDVLERLAKYRYRRTFATPFSDGSISGMGDQMLSIYVYEGDSLTNSALITSSGKIAVNDRCYRMDDANPMIDELIALLDAAY